MSAPEAAPTTALTTGAPHVFADTGIDEHAARVAAVIDPAFLAEAGWDPVGLVLSAPPEHPLLGRPVCRAEGCLTTATDRSGICACCRRRPAEHGLGEDEIALLPARARQRSGRGPDTCVVDGCAREWVSSRSALCRPHLDLAQALGIGTEDFLAHPMATPLDACAECSVVACTRQRRHHNGVYCHAHQQRLHEARRRDPNLDEQHWRLIEAAVGRGGEVSLRGLPPLVVAEVLVGLQQRCRVNAVKTGDAVLRALCDDLRRQQVTSLAQYVTADHRGLEFRGLANCLAGHAHRALATPDTEVGPPCLFRTAD